MPYHTPQSAGGVYLSRRICIPVELAPIVTGALEVLTNRYVWEQVGTMAIDDAIELCTTMLNAWLDSEHGGCMTGELWHGISPTAAPSGVLLFDGSSYLRVDYPALYAMLPAAWIDDADNFTLPDLSGRAISIAGTGYSAADLWGTETHTLTIAELPAHQHGSHNHGISTADPIAGIPLPSPDLAFPDLTASEGGGGSHPNEGRRVAFIVGVWS